MWYTNAGLKPLGPFELIDIHEKIKKGHLSPQDLIFNENFSDWKPAQEWEEVRRLGFPAFEAVGMDEQDKLVWIVLRRNPVDQKYTQEGPLDGTQIISFLKYGSLLEDDLVWKKGLSGWARIGDRAEFTSLDL